MSATTGRRLLAAFGVVLAVSQQACGGRDLAREGVSRKPTAAPSMHVDLSHGIDVSVHSGEVDWSRVAEAGYTFAVVKASEGVDLPDSAHDQHWMALAETPLVRGAYHFYVTEDDPEQQARLFLQTARLQPGDLAPVVDVELMGHGTPPGLAQRLERFLHILEEHFGVRPIIYTSAGFWNRHLPPDFGGYPLWVAEYDVDEPTLPHGWDSYHLWQYVGDAKVAGVEKDADLSRGHPQTSHWHELLIPPQE